MKLTELEQHIKLAKKHKLAKMTIGDISFELRDPVKRNTVREVTHNEIPIVGERMPSDDQMLFYSSESAITQTS